MCEGWSKDGAPDIGLEEATVQVHVLGGFPDLDGFQSSPEPEPLGPYFGLWRLPS